MPLCNLCGFNSDNERALQKHMEVHDFRKFDCDICSKTFVGLKTVRDHKIVHLMAECLHCNKSIPKKGKNRHQQTCSGRRDQSQLSVRNALMNSKRAGFIKASKFRLRRSSSSSSPPSSPVRNMIMLNQFPEL